MCFSGAPVEALGVPGAVRVRDLKVWVLGLGFRDGEMGVWGSGFRVWGLGFRVWGLGFRD